MKEIFQHDFWKQRIKTARVPYFSVYVTNSADWAHIERTHRKIISEHVTGSLLDAGCGYGRASEWYDDYTGVDFSPDFIERAKRMYPDKPFFQADLRDLPFEDKQFDWAMCISIKRMVIDNKGEKPWNEMEKELKRVATNLLILEYEHAEEFEIL